MSNNSTQLSQAQLLHDAQTTGIPIAPPHTETYPNLSVQQSHSIQKRNIGIRWCWRRGCVRPDMVFGLNSHVLPPDGE